MANERFPARLKELREAAGLSQKELAEKAGLSQRAVSHWEQGLREPSYSNAVTLAEALGVDCRAFQEEPAERPPQGPGRPAKAVEDETAAAPPKKRGRPRKGESK